MWSENMTNLGKKANPGEVSKYGVWMVASWTWGCQDTNLRDNDLKA